MKGYIEKQKLIEALENRTHLEWKLLKILYPMLDVIEDLPSIDTAEVWEE